MIYEPCLPGTRSAGMRKLAKERTTMAAVGMKTLMVNLLVLRSNSSRNPVTDRLPASRSSPGSRSPKVTLKGLFFSCTWR